MFQCELCLRAFALKDVLNLIIEAYAYGLSGNIFLCQTALNRYVHINVVFFKLFEVNLFCKTSGEDYPDYWYTHGYSCDSDQL